MTFKAEITTPQTDPNHDTVGYTFRAWDGHYYWCDSWESNAGFWMTRLDAPSDRRSDTHSEYRRNVSERTIGRTYHQQYSQPWRATLDPASAVEE